MDVKTHLAGIFETVHSKQHENMYVYGRMYHLDGQAVTGIYPKKDAITPKRKPLSLKEIHASEDLENFWNSSKPTE
jgi:hypothetical protein